MTLRFLRTSPKSGDGEGDDIVMGTVVPLNVFRFERETLRFYLTQIY